MIKLWGEEWVKTIQKYRDDFQNFSLLLNEIDTCEMANIKNDFNISKLFRHLHNIYDTDFIYDVACGMCGKSPHTFSNH